MQKPRKKGGQTADAWSGARSKSTTKQQVPVAFQGFLRVQRSADKRLDDDACKRVRKAWEEGGEQKALYVEQLEWLRYGIANGELSLKDALPVFRGISKILETMNADASAPVSVTVVRGPAQEKTTGDKLVVH